MPARGRSSFARLAGIGLCRDRLPQRDIPRLSANLAACPSVVQRTNESAFARAMASRLLTPAGAMNDEVEEPMSDQSTAEKPLRHALHNAPPAAGRGPGPDF